MTKLDSVAPARVSAYYLNMKLACCLAILGALYDPLLWQDTKQLLSGESHRQALAIMDEFLTKHAERRGSQDAPPHRGVQRAIRVLRLHPASRRTGGDASLSEV